MSSGVSQGLLHRSCSGNTVKTKVDRCRLRSPGVLHAKGTLVELLKLRWVLAKGFWGTPCWGCPGEVAGVEVRRSQGFSHKKHLAGRLKLKWL